MTKNITSRTENQVNHKPNMLRIHILYRSSILYTCAYGLSFRVSSVTRIRVKVRVRVKSTVRESKFCYQSIAENDTC